MGEKGWEGGGRGLSSVPQSQICHYTTGRETKFKEVCNYCHYFVGDSTFSDFNYIYEFKFSY